MEGEALLSIFIQRYLAGQIERYTSLIRIQHFNFSTAALRTSLAPVACFSTAWYYTSRIH